MISDDKSDIDLAPSDVSLRLEDSEIASLSADMRVRLTKLANDLDALGFSASAAYVSSAIDALDAKIEPNRL